MTYKGSRLISFILLALLITIVTCGVCTNALSIPQADECFYVNDYADVISEETEDYICSAVESIEDKTGAQIVIVTVIGLDNENIERYSKSLFNEWGIGSSEKNNGILFLMALAEDDYWAMLGSGLENSFGNGTLGLILDDYVESYFAAQDYDGAAKAFTDQAIVKLSDIYNIDSSSLYLTQNETQNNNNNNNTQNSTEGSKLSTIAALFVFLIAFLILRLIFRVIRGIFSGIFGLFSPRPPRYFGGYNFHRGFYGDRFHDIPHHDGHFESPRRGSFGGSRGGFGGFGESHGSFGGSSRGGFGGSHSSSHSGGGGSSRGGGAGRGRR